MKKIVLLIIIILVVVLIKTWGFWATPIENPEVDMFEEYYVDDDFTVYIRSELVEYWEMVGYGFGKRFATQCMVGGYEDANYMFYYKDKYYDIVEINKINIVSCEDLYKMGMIYE